MAKSDELAFNKLIELINDGQVVQLQKTLSGYEVTVWPRVGELNHHHYQGETALEAVLKIK